MVDLVTSATGPIVINLASSESFSMGASFDIAFKSFIAATYVAVSSISFLGTSAGGAVADDSDWNGTLLSRVSSGFSSTARRGFIGVFTGTDIPGGAFNGLNAVGAYGLYCDW